MSNDVRLLVIDDEPDMGLISQALGKRCGWKVDHRLNAATAWEYLQQHRPDLVLVDVRLPGISGPELCRRVRLDGRLADLKLALFTHGGVPEDVAQGLEAGVPYLVNKELVCRPDAWQQRISEILAAPHGQGLARPVKWMSKLLDPELGRLAAALPGVFRHSSLRGLALPILRAVVRQALRQAYGAAAVERGPLEEWLLCERLGSQTYHLPPEGDPQSASLLAACLAEQLWCLLGESASAPVRAVLASVTPDQQAEGTTCR